MVAEAHQKGVADGFRFKFLKACDASPKSFPSIFLGHEGRRRDVRAFGFVL
jgi:hypothetical protein